jgi:hypothetical protein
MHPDDVGVLEQQQAQQLAQGALMRLIVVLGAFLSTFQPSIIVPSGSPWDASNAIITRPPSRSS